MGGVYFGALAVLVAAVAGLYLLKPPPRRSVVPSNLVWEQVLRQARIVNDRWRWWLSLILAAFIACLVATALLRPSTGRFGGDGRLALIVDDTATMGTRTGDGRSRFQHALAQARALIERNSIILVADTAHLLPTPEFGDRQAAFGALDKLQVTYDAAPNFPDIAQMTTDPLLVHAVFVTDGVGVHLVPPGVQVISVFEPAFNVGITAFDIRAVPGDGGQVQALVEVTNGAAQPVSAQIEIAGRNGRRALARVAIGAMQKAATLIDVSIFDDGPVAARVRSAGDALAIDDVAYGWMPSLRALRVGLVTSGSEYLEKVLRLTPRVRLSVLQPAQFDPASKADIWVFDRFSPRDVPSQPVLLFRPPDASWLPKRVGEIASPLIRGWNVSHPLMENLAAKDVLVDQALHFARADDTVLLREAHGAALILAQETSPRRVIVGFALEDSNFALEAGFPVFLANCLNWLAAEPIVRTQGLGPVILPSHGARVVGMDGTEVKTLVAPQGVVFDSGEPGLFTAVARNSIVHVAVNVLDARVTQVNGSLLPPMNDMATEAAFSPAIVPWRLLLLLAMLLLLVEWWTWNRRLTV